MQVNIKFSSVCSGSRESALLSQPPAQIPAQGSDILSCIVTPDGKVLEQISDPARCNGDEALQGCVIFDKMTSGSTVTSVTL